MPRKPVHATRPAVPTAACGEHAGGAGKRKAVGVDAQLKAASLTRLRRAEGQVRGILRMVDEDRYCADVITQISAVQESLRAVAKGLLRNHLMHCATAAMKRGPREADAMHRELLDLMSKMAR